MFSFLSSILWIAVFCGGSYKLYKSIKAENIDMDLTKDKVEKLTEQSPILWGLTTLEHLNNKANVSSITLYASIIAFSLWAMEAQVLGGLFLLSILVFGVFFTLHLSRVMGDMGYSFFKFDKKFRLAQTPFFLCIILFFGVPQILPTPEVSNQPQATSNKKAKKTKLDTRASSDEIKYVMKEEYADKEQIQEWINRIGYDNLETLVRKRANCAGRALSSDCLGYGGEIESEITSIEKTIACADDYRNCTSVSKWSVGRQDYKIREDCTEAVNKKAKKNVMQLYYGAEWPRVSEWNGATITWHNYDAGYQCKYSLAEETISVSAR